MKNCFRLNEIFTIFALKVKKWRRYSKVKVKVGKFNHRFNRHRTWFTVFNFPAGNSPNLGVNHHLEVIRTRDTYIPAGSSPNLGVSHHLEVIRTWDTYIPQRELTQPWCEPSPWSVWNGGYLHTHRASVLEPVLPIFAGTIFTPWSGEAVIYWDTARCLYPSGDRTPALCSGRSKIIIRLPGLTVARYCIFSYHSL